MREIPKLTPRTIKKVNNLSLPNLLEHREFKREIKTICITGTLQTNHPYTKFLLSKAKELKTCEQRFFTTFKMTRVLAMSLTATNPLSAQVPFSPFGPFINLYKKQAKTAFKPFLPV